MKHLFAYPLLTLLGTLLLCTSTFAGELPALPGDFQPKQPAKLTVLEFSAPSCLSCRKLKPHVKALEKKYAHQLHFVHLNVEDEATETYIELYELDSIPTFVLYNGQGKGLEKIERDITPAELRTIVKKALKAS